MKCAYSRCFCEEKSLDDKDVVIINNKRFHSQCYSVREDINQIKILFHDHINENVVWTQLINVINTIIFERGCTAGFLLFGLKYYIEHKIPLNYPAGLYYVVQNKDVKREWDRLKANEIKKQMIQNTTVDNGQQFTYRPIKTKGIGDLLC